jgi:hypothetical protein
MSAGPINLSNINPSNINAIASCADLQANWRAVSAETPELKVRYQAADERYQAAELQRNACRDALMQNGQKLLGLAGQMNAIPGCAIPK